MSDGSWQFVLKDYRDAQKQSWGEDFVWMEKLISHLLENRDLSMLYPITSHYRLSAFIGKDFNEVYHKPSISINLTHEVRPQTKDKYRFKFSITTGYEEDEIWREFVESVYCSFEQSLNIFDEIFAKLKGATETRLIIHPNSD